MNEDIDNQLRAWKVEAEAPVRFQAGVWSRIAAREEARQLSFSHRLAEWFAMLARPRYAMAFASLIVLLSITVANVESRQTNSTIWKNLQTRYVTSIDPRLHVLAMQ